MNSPDVNRFSAAGSALGYLAQVEYALLLALQRMENAVELRLSIETADDITFEAEGLPRELWQAKHHISRHGSLGDASSDIWKTLHNWIETAGTVPPASSSVRQQHQQTPPHDSSACRGARRD